MITTGDRPKTSGRLTWPEAMSAEATPSHRGVLTSSSNPAPSALRSTSGKVPSGGPDLNVRLWPEELIRYLASLGWKGTYLFLIIVLAILANVTAYSIHKATYLKPDKAAVEASH